MNTDDFEKQLERQSLRQPPAAWREEILAVARANIRSASPATEPGIVAGWQTLLARIPVAWSAVAALWLIIIGANSLVSGPNITTSTSTPAGNTTMTAWSAQRIQASLLASGPADLLEIAPPRETPPSPPRPRSDRRRDDGLGNMNTPPRRVTIA